MTALLHVAQLFFLLNFSFKFFFSFKFSQIIVKHAPSYSVFTELDNNRKKMTLVGKKKKVLN